MLFYPPDVSMEHKTVLSHFRIIITCLHSAFTSKSKKPVLVMDDFRRRYAGTLRLGGDRGFKLSLRKGKQLPFNAAQEDLSESNDSIMTPVKNKPAGLQYK
jgi:hypothetical protein